MALSVQETFKNKHVMVTGVTGFLGKVFFTMLMDRLPGVGKVYVLLRKKGLRGAKRRFDKIMNSSPALRPLHEKHGADLATFMATRVEVVDGDISQPGLGMDPAINARLMKDVDVIINCAGLVDFAPDVRWAIETNVHGTMNTARWASDSRKARLLQISTCYVVGLQSGTVEEQVRMGVAPCGDAYDARAEYNDLQAAIAGILEECDGDAFGEMVEARVQLRIEQDGLDTDNETLMKNVRKRERERQITRKMVEEGERRADRWGWPNIYTYSKSMAERLLTEEKLDCDWALFRPAIVESSMEFPFPGWNEGFNTCGPLAYLLKTWFRGVPGAVDHPFDVIPVDVVCEAMFVAATALMHGTHNPVYHCGSSDRATFTVERGIELTSLAHRQHMREHGESFLERSVLSRWDGVRTKPDGLFSAKNVRKSAQGLSKFLNKVSGPKAVEKHASKLAKSIDSAENSLKPVEKICDLFRPFIHDNRWVFETKSLVKHHIVEDNFRFEPENKINWRHYWLQVHVPGLRRWSFPAFEGKKVETYKPEHKFTLRTAATEATATATAGSRPLRVAAQAER